MIVKIAGTKLMNMGELLLGIIMSYFTANSAVFNYIEKYYKAYLLISSSIALLAIHLADLEDWL